MMRVHQDAPSRTLPLPPCRPGMMRVHQDAPSRTLHSITHFDDAPWAAAPSFRTTDGQATLEPERWGGAVRSPAALRLRHADATRARRQNWALSVMRVLPVGIDLRQLRRQALHGQIAIEQ